MKAAAALTAWPSLVWFAGQLEHPKWNGFALYDLIFPLFLFMAGVSMPFSFEKRLERGDTRGDLCRHVIVRGLLLVFIGMIYNGLLKFDWPNTRYPSVLGRIGLAYLFAGLIVLSTRVRGQVVVADWRVGCILGGAAVYSGAGLRRTRLGTGAYVDGLHRSFADSGAFVRRRS